MFILGINAYHGDVSAVLLRDGVIVAAVEEERFRRIKHVAGFPTRSDPRLSRDGRHHGPRHRPRRRLAQPACEHLRARPGTQPRCCRPAACSETARTTTGRSARFPTRSPRPSISHRARRRPKIHWVEHHPAHLASTFFVSPFDDAAVCAIDGFGDFVSTSWAIGRGTRIDDHRSHVLSAFAGDGLPGDDAVPRLHEVRRRVQGHGPRALRRARLRRRGQPARAPAAGRPLRARPVVLQALDRAARA